MKILHIAMASHFTPGMTYQENYLTAQNALDGHETTILTDCHRYEGGKLVSCPPEDTVLENGVRLIRLSTWKGRDVSPKLFFIHGFARLLEELNPDVLLFHGMVVRDFATAVRYKRAHPEKRLFADSHIDFGSAGRGMLSRVLLHGLFYRWQVRRALPDLDGLYYISEECGDYLEKQYGIPRERMDYWPLGGVCPTEEAYREKRRAAREELGLSEKDLALFHTGKLDPEKRTPELLRAFHSVTGENLRLFLVGAMTPEVAAAAKPILQADGRIRELGWKNADQLYTLLCGADLYLQPGHNSATLQNAACCRAGICTWPYASYRTLFGDDCFYVETEADLRRVLQGIARDPGQLLMKREASARDAEEKLDYSMLARVLYR